MPLNIKRLPRLPRLILIYATILVAAESWSATRHGPPPVGLAVACAVFAALTPTLQAMTFGVSRNELRQAYRVRTTGRPSGDQLVDQAAVKLLTQDSRTFNRMAPYISAAVITAGPIVAAIRSTPAWLFALLFLAPMAGAVIYTAAVDDSRRRLDQLTRALDDCADS